MIKKFGEFGFFSKYENNYNYAKKEDFNTMIIMGDNK